LRKSGIIILERGRLSTIEAERLQAIADEE
jgi:hypothetical protein